VIVSSCKGSYDNNTIDEVLNSIDIVIVPSTWYEELPPLVNSSRGHFLAGLFLVITFRRLVVMAELC